ncbi:SH3 domain-containing protein 19 isoform X2 [Anabas testudineus]|uniref:SH3 domain-containing protein 19 isoform X2 n=1 Tax=Anabas testudineus TaxID=64144 RepID=UPI000E46339D|nr:SH3 domain-containing protein 19 isoform X2 [Anabas testudineus]
MAESRREEDGELERRDVRDVRSRSQTTDHPERKAEHLHSCQGPLSSIRAAIKRTRTISQGDQTRDRRRPEITIVSAEPLASNNWFPGTSVVFAPSQSSWSAGTQTVSQPPPSYDQVIQEKTQEEHTVKPTAAPRRSTCTTTSATQTDPVKEDPNSAVPQCTVAPQTAVKRPAGKKPQKPPRPSLPKLVDREVVAETPTDRKAGTNTTASTTNEGQNDSKPDVKQLSQSDSTNTCTRSVTVHWDIPTTAPNETPSSSDSKPSQCPIPLPRIKSRKQPIKEEVNNQILVKLADNSDNIQSDPQEISTNEYLKELLEVFSGENECEAKCGIVNQSDEASQGEDAVGEMSANNGQRNIWARIQAFENQGSTDEGNAAEQAKPELPSRKPSIRPPVAAKPSVAFKPQVNNLIDSYSQNTSPANVPQIPVLGPRPQPSRKPGGSSIKEELEALHSKAALTNKISPVLTKANSIYEAETSTAPTPPANPFKDPLKPNLNINNHNSASLFTENEYMNTLTDHFPVKPQHYVDSNGGSFARQSITKRPTTIRVTGKTGSFTDNFLENPPPLPTHKPVGSLLNQKQSPAPTLSFQDPFQFGPEPSLPPRRTKTLPPRPSPAKPGPGRPPPPTLQATGRSLSVPWETSPKPQMPPRKGPILPPRPKPGHRLYNKYILELPHGIAAVDYNGSNTGELSFQKNEVLLLLEETDRSTFECQVGDTRGRVHKSRMKVITPLGSDVFLPQGAGSAASGGDGYGKRVQVIHDFSPAGPGELELRAGDVVTMVEQVDNEWYKGTCRGSTGFFPISYVKPLSDSPKSLPKRKPKPPPATISGPRCVARFDFEGEHSDELSFSEGDVIQLKEYMGEDWARGKLGVLTGIFPLNFVEIIEDLPPPPSQQQTQPSRRALPGMMSMVASPSAHPAEASNSSEDWVVALYDYAGKSDDDLSIEQGDYILLIQHLDSDWSYGRLNGREGMFPRSYVESTGPPSCDNQQNEPASGGRARALYNFNSDCDEELTLQVGDIITNLESIDEEWFLGELRGKKGLVPKNYVQVLG